jgi:hypothetical protein
VEDHESRDQHWGKYQEEVAPQEGNNLSPDKGYFLVDMRGE